MKLTEIQHPISAEMTLFEKKFKTAMQSRAPLLDKITQYIVKRKGKQMRPMFVFLSAGLLGEINDSTYRGAILVELLHTATLVHDDIVDDSYERRGMFSINALWKNKIAVLVGDYLLSKGLLLSLDNDDFGLLKLVSDAVRKMSEGELLQIEKSRKLDITEDVYFEIIRNKTASLIASCCAVGSSSVNSDQESVEKMRLFGEYVGIAFQIKDDLLDFGDENTGKPKGADIKEKKMTLPLIHALSNATSSQKREIINIIKNKRDEKGSLEKVVNFIIQHKGIDYSNQKIQYYKEKALAILNDFPESEYKKSLENLVAFTINRKK